MQLRYLCHHVGLLLQQEAGVEVSASEHHGLVPLLVEIPRGRGHTYNQAYRVLGSSPDQVLQ